MIKNEILHNGGNYSFPLVNKGFIDSKGVIPLLHNSFAFYTLAAGIEIHFMKNSSTYSLSFYLLHSSSAKDPALKDSGCCK